MEVNKKELKEQEIRTLFITPAQRYLKRYSDELSADGYILCKGKRFKETKLCFVSDIYDGSKTTRLGLFDFRSFLDMDMLLTESAIMFQDQKK